MKRIINFLLTISIIITAFGTTAFADGTADTIKSDDNANSWRYENGQTIIDPYDISPLADPYHPDATLTGIDVTRHQGQINWEKVQAAGVDFAIIRCGFAEDKPEYDDPYWEYNSSECERLGIPYGVYLYSYAESVEDALSEADHVLRLIDGKKLSFPVYYDLEDNTIQTSNLTAIASAFCNKIEAAGYYVGVYANLHWWNNYLTDSCFDNWHRWVAQWSESCTYDGKYAMWQYTSKGIIDGIDGYVDMNYLIGYPSGHGNFSGGVSRIYGSTRFETAFKAADELKNTLNVSKFDNIIVASATNFADALSGSYLASVKNAPILITSEQYSSTVKEYIKNNLNENGTVYILGGVNAVSAEMENGLDGFTVKRLGGATRYETNLEILKESGSDGKDILIATGTNFADSLSASASKLPILLVDQSLTDTQKEFLASATVSNKIIIGGPNAVSPQIEGEVKAFGNVERIGGDTRYETSVLLAEKLFTQPEIAVLAYAQNFPDGLCGGALAASVDAPLILTASGSGAAAAKYISSNDIRNGYVLGGQSLIDDKTVCDIFRITDGTAIPAK